MMLVEIVYGWLVTLVLLAAVSIVQPTRAIAPIGWYVNGVAPDGIYRVRKAPDRERPCSLGWNGCIDNEPEREFRSRIYCTGGAYPIVVSDRIVGCQR